MRVGLVNNMPDGAFAETEHQFLRLIRAGSSERSLQVSRYWMHGIERGALTRRKIRRSYLPVDDLYGDPPDALIVTGTEPRSPDLRDEPYWQPLSALIAWGERSVPVMLLSCLASHAALLTLDCVERRALPAKLSGVFDQQPHASHRLVAGLGLVAFPHSRLNDVPASTLRERGYTVLVDTPDVGWTVASRERDGRLLVLLQGHPEYSVTALLREYRRDVRRYLEGTSSVYPAIPVGYLDEYGVGLLEAFRRTTDGCGRPEIGDFPFEEAAAHIAVSWQADSERLLANWLAEATDRSAPALPRRSVERAIPRQNRA